MFIIKRLANNSATKRDVLCCTDNVGYLEVVVGVGGVCCGVGVVSVGGGVGVVRVGGGGYFC